MTDFMVELPSMIKQEKEVYIAFLAVISIFLYLVLRFIFSASMAISPIPLYIALIFGGIPHCLDKQTSHSRLETNN